MAVVFQIHQQSADLFRRDPDTGLYQQFLCVGCGELEGETEGQGRAFPPDQSQAEGPDLSPEGQIPFCE